MAGWKAPRIFPQWPGDGNFKVSHFLNVLYYRVPQVSVMSRRSPTGWFSYALFPFSCTHLTNSMSIWFYQKNQQAAWKNTLRVVPLPDWSSGHWRLESTGKSNNDLSVLGIFPCDFRCIPPKNLYINGYLLKFQTKELDI